jgi:hypothetical protein
MDSATWKTYNELLRVIKFVIDTKIFRLKVQRRLDNYLGWNLKVFCDRDWAGDTETRVTVTGFIIYLLNVPICWRSKSQKGVTLSSTEAEDVAISDCMAMSEAVKEICFIFYLLRYISISVDLPIMVRTDNIAARFMAENASSGFRTRHIDTTYHFIREHVEDSFIKIVLIKTGDNRSDFFIKNFNKDTYERHVLKPLGNIDG